MYYVNNITIGGDTMLKSYLKIISRNILKHKGYSFINILGLTIGMAVCILILLWVRDELSFDRFHKNANEIYRVVEEEIQSNGEILRAAVTPWPLGAALVKDYPGVINFTRYDYVGRRYITYKAGNKSFRERNVYVADPSFLDMFSFPLVKGDPATALSKANTVVITEEIAEKYFGKKNPLGKILTINNRYDVTVTGVLKNLPHNSHLKFGFLLPFEQTLKNSRFRGKWNSHNYSTFILVQKNLSAEKVEALEEKIYEYLYRINPRYITRFRLQALTDIHLRSNYAIDLYGASKDSSLYIYIFSLIAGFILLIACINFINLTIARASTRAKEVGLRKTTGATRKDLIIQFQLAGKELTLDPFSNIGTALGLLLIAIVTGITAGIYPAIIQSSFQPANIIKGNFTFSSGKPWSSLSRKALVVFQFTLSIALIIGTLVVNKQFTYIQDTKLGYEEDHIIYFTKNSNVRKEYDTFKDELKKNPNVLAVTTSSDVPTYTVADVSLFRRS
jgi:ABC-type antimicrobial peptide transport system permease subunit